MRGTCEFTFYEAKLVRNQVLLGKLLFLLMDN